MFDATARPRARKGATLMDALVTYFSVIQINPKFRKIQQSPAKSGPRQSKKKAWISLDSLGGNEPFQRVVVTPWGKKSFLAPSPPNWPRRAALSFPNMRQGNTGFYFSQTKCSGKFRDDGGGSAFHDSPGDQGDSVKTRHALGQNSIRLVSTREHAFKIGLLDGRGRRESGLWLKKRIVPKA
jgi:hypothetical protein